MPRKKKAVPLTGQWDSLVSVSSSMLQEDQMTGSLPSSGSSDQVFVSETATPKPDAEPDTGDFINIAYILASIATTPNNTAQTAGVSSAPQTNGNYSTGIHQQQQHMEYHHGGPQMVLGSPRPLSQPHDGPWKHDMGPGLESGSLAMGSAISALPGAKSHNAGNSMLNGHTTLPSPPPQHAYSPLSPVPSCCPISIPPILLQILDRPDQTAPLLEHLQQFKPYVTELCPHHSIKYSAITSAFLIDQLAALQASQPNWQNSAIQPSSTAGLSNGVPSPPADEAPPAKRQRFEDRSCAASYYECAVDCQPGNHCPRQDHTWQIPDSQQPNADQSIEDGQGPPSTGVQQPSHDHGPDSIQVQVPTAARSHKPQRGQKSGSSKRPKASQQPKRETAAEPLQFPPQVQLPDHAQQPGHVQPPDERHQHDHNQTPEHDQRHGVALNTTHQSAPDNVRIPDYSQRTDAAQVPALSQYPEHPQHPTFVQGGGHFGDKRDSVQSPYDTPASGEAQPSSNHNSERHRDADQNGGLDDRHRSQLAFRPVVPELRRIPHHLAPPEGFAHGMVLETGQRYNYMQQVEHPLQIEYGQQPAHPQEFDHAGSSSAQRHPHNVVHPPSHVGHPSHGYISDYAMSAEVRQRFVDMPQPHPEAQRFPEPQVFDQPNAQAPENPRQQGFEHLNYPHLEHSHLRHPHPENHSNTVHVQHVDEAHTTHQESSKKDFGNDSDPPLRPERGQKLEHTSSPAFAQLQHLPTASHLQPSLSQGHGHHQTVDRGLSFPHPYHNDPHFYQGPDLSRVPQLDKARDNQFRLEVIQELQAKESLAKGKSHGDVTGRLVLKLLQLCQSPDDSEAYVLSGYEAARRMEAGTTDCPIFTEGQQQYTWEPDSRPIDQMFQHMENLNRAVSVQVPSRKSHTRSFQKQKLLEIQQRFLESADMEREDPWNVLDLSNPLPPSTMPQFLTGKNCQLLARVRDAVLGQGSGERTAAVKEKWNEWTNVMEWVLMAEGGHNTAPHTDSHGLSTWITVQEGLFGFGWLSKPTQEERKAWIMNPQEFTGGRWRFTLLTAGKTVFFPSGTIHFVFRLRRGQTLALGGHILQWNGVERWISIVREQIKSPQITNEDVEWSAPKYVRVISEMVKYRADNGRLAELGGKELVDSFFKQVEEFEKELKEIKAAPKPTPKKRKR